MSLLCLPPIFPNIRRLKSRLPRHAGSHDSEPSSASTPTDDAQSSPTELEDDESKSNKGATAKTAMNALKISLKTLGSISSNVPFGGILDGAIVSLLDILDRIDQSSLNAQALIQLTSRIEMLEPVVQSSNSQNGKTIIEALEREIRYIETDLKTASAQGKLAQFFNSEDNASAISKHNTALTQLIADSTFATVNEALTLIHALEARKHEEVVRGEYDIEVITGGLGGTGGAGQIGGEGGIGEGPDVELPTNMRVNTISGGTGGTGGEGVEVGGVGGIGKAPVIRFSRGRQYSDSDR
ncbi:hypothetical protein MIND_00025400 [Mycena indigotica]|uniref:Uncharacterized protein n=1 Tax=Mycena indigotica TaxID=2126181 RepID=A0A8H6TCV4_9AGAR|nr:uncharacterized protein MIND_00025400 [Mycena indigotica]KAF7315111.1 hypothetical protein MIND_00025400 [Mycena indigotica]